MNMLKKSQTAAADADRVIADLASRIRELQARRDPPPRQLSPSRRRWAPRNSM
jgi:hypothetical protein